MTHAAKSTKGNDTLRSIISYELSSWEREMRNRFEDVENTANNRIVYCVFKAKYDVAMSVAQIDHLGAALTGFSIGMPELRKVLTKLTAQGVLRSRNIEGAIHYEVNYVA